MFPHKGKTRSSFSLSPERFVITRCGNAQVHYACMTFTLPGDAHTERAVAHGDGQRPPPKMMSLRL
jgi:hypothetical protein